jgi:hypothetical protein
MDPDGGMYVASGSWNLLGAGQMECAEGKRCTHSGLPVRLKIKTLTARPIPLHSSHLPPIRAERERPGANTLRSADRRQR